MSVNSFRLVRNILALIILVLPVALVFGCSQISEIANDEDSSSTGNLQTVQKAELASKWIVNQMKITLNAEEEMSVLMKLANADKVDGYFYMEKGDKVNFRIMGSSSLYEYKAEAGKSPSDRFTFVATTGQGSTYTLTLRNPSSKGDASAKAVVFLELIYPKTASLFTPME